MKIIIKKDLIEIVDASNGVFKLHASAIMSTKFCALAFLASAGAKISGLKDSIEIPHLLIFSAALMSSSLLAEKIVTKIYSAEIKEKCINNLNMLIPILREAGIDTSLEFIRQASTIETKYKLSMHSFPPKIIQTKTISIPSYTIHPNTKESFLEQQHELGSEQYVLTLGNSSKKCKLVPSYNQV